MQDGCAKELVQVDGYYERTKKAALLAIESIQRAYKSGEHACSDKEQSWLDRLADQVARLLDSVGEFTQSMIDECGKLDPKKYNM